MTRSDVALAVVLATMTVRAQQNAPASEVALIKPHVSDKLVAGQTLTKGVEPRSWIGHFGATVFEQTRRRRIERRYDAPSMFW